MYQFFGFILLLECGIFVRGDSITFQNEISNLMNENKSILLSGKAFVNLTTEQTFSFLDYYWLNNSNKAQFDLFLEYSKSNNSHRIISSPIFNGTLHSAVGYIKRKFAKSGFGYDSKRILHLRPSYEYRSEFTSDCNFSDISKYNRNDYALSYRNYPSVSVGGLSKIYSLAALFFHPNFKQIDFTSSESRLGSKSYKVYNCSEGCKGLNVNVDLGFENSSSPASLDTLRYARINTIGDETFEFFVHKVTVFDSPDDMRYSGEFQPQDGVECQNLHHSDGENSDTVEMNWPAHFSMTSEYLDFANKKVSYIDELYDIEDGLSRITLRGFQLSVNTTGNKMKNFSSSSVVVDYSSELAFVGVRGDECTIISSNRLRFLRYGKYRDSLLPMLQHPTDLFNFNETMTLKGFCEDAFGVPGKLYLSRNALGDDDEMCVLDRERNAENWAVGAMNDQDYLVPMWMADYDMRQSSDVSESAEQHRIQSLANFLDVSDKQVMLDAFDVSHCFKSDHVNYYVLLATKTSNYSEEDVNKVWGEGEGEAMVRHSLCLQSPAVNRKEATVCDSLSIPAELGAHGFRALYTHVASLKLATELNVYPLRISDLTLDDTTPEISVIAFALLDFAGMSQYKQVNSRPQMLSNDVVESRMKSLKGDIQMFYSVQVEMPQSDGSTKVEQKYFKDSYRVFSHMEISKQTFDMIANRSSSKGGSGHVMTIVLIVVSIVMLSVGIIVGIAVAHKLWRGATSFGYMIHSNVM